MGYYVSSMIGIRTGGVFSNKTDMDDLRTRIRKVSLECEKEGGIGLVQHDPSNCMSRELVAQKGTYVVIAGVFNYWTWNWTSVFASKLSKEFGTEVMIMTWNEENGDVNCNIYLDGEELFEVVENPIGRTLRRIM